jgi:hypothetical protein
MRVNIARLRAAATMNIIPVITADRAQNEETKMNANLPIVPIDTNGRLTVKQLRAKLADANDDDLVCVCVTTEEPPDEGRRTAASALRVDRGRAGRGSLT